jgi:hypothetical protein
MEKEKPTKVRLSADLSPNVAKALKTLAEKQGISMTEALGRAIGTESYLQEKRDSGSKVLVREESGDVKEVVFSRHP